MYFSTQFIYFLPAQTGLSGFCAAQTENPVVHSHLYDPTVLWQAELAPHASEDRHSSTSVEVTTKTFHETWECYYKPRYRAILTMHITLNRDCNSRITQNCSSFSLLKFYEVSKLIFREIRDFVCPLKPFIIYKKVQGLLMSTLWFTPKTVMCYFLRPLSVPDSKILSLYYAFNLDFYTQMSSNTSFS